MHAMTYKARRSRVLIGRVYTTALLLIILMLIGVTLRSDGIYSNIINIISVFPKDHTFEENLFISSHEIGHYVYFVKLTPEQRNSYEQLFNDTNERVDDYANTNAAESFAQEFAYTITYNVNMITVPTEHRQFWIDNQKDIYRMSYGVDMNEWNNEENKIKAKDWDSNN